VSEAGVATKFDLPPREIPQTVVVTTQKLIKDFNLTDVKQILQFTPGIYVENERNVGAYQYFSRGDQLQVRPYASAIATRSPSLQGTARRRLLSARDPSRITSRPIRAAP
jgi:outer membrane receptor for monomeric catechols